MTARKTALLYRMVKRGIGCACVGGSSRVPLSFASLTENVMMVAMALWMPIRPAM